MQKVTFHSIKSGITGFFINKYRCDICWTIVTEKQKIAHKVLHFKIANKLVEM